MGPFIYYVSKRTDYIYAAIVGGSKKVQNYADVIYGWYLSVCPDFRLSSCILSSRAHFISHCWLWVRFHASVLSLCLSLDMLAKLFFFDKNTIIGMFIAVKNKKVIVSKSLNVLS